MKRWRYVLYGAVLAALAASAGRGVRKPGERFEEPVGAAERFRGSEGPADRPDVSTLSARGRSFASSPALERRVERHAPPAQARVADPVAGFLDDPTLTPDQVEGLRGAAAVKQERLQRLQEEVYREGLGREEVSARARRIQEEFEGELGALLTPAQAETYGRLKQEGRVGTYAILVPDATQLR